jgi:hypothetical protein
LTSYCARSPRGTSPFMASVWMALTKTSPRQRDVPRKITASRLTCGCGDLFSFSPPAPVDAIAMHRALHHVWHDEPRGCAWLRGTLVPGGVVIWEPAWPVSREALRTPRLQGMAFQNLSEHVQDNHHVLAPQRLRQLSGVSG